MAGIELGLSAADMLLIRGEFTDDELNVAVTVVDNTYTELRATSLEQLPTAHYEWTAASETSATVTVDWTTETMTAGSLVESVGVPGTGNTSREASLLIFGIVGGLQTVTVTNGSATTLASFDASLAYTANPYTDPQGKKWYVQGSGWQYRRRSGLVFPSVTLGHNVTTANSFMNPVGAVSA